MFNPFKTYIRALLLMLALGTGYAQAGVLYAVTVDTRAFSGDGYLDFTFNALAGATPATATLSQFGGNFGSTHYLSGAASGDVGSTVVLENSGPFNELLQSVTFGGLFTFNVQFDGAASGSMGTNFGVALVNAALDNYLAGTSGDVFVAGLTPGGDNTLTVTQGLTSVTVIPEPASIFLFSAGAVLLAVARRRTHR